MKMHKTHRGIQVWARGAVVAAVLASWALAGATNPTVAQGPIVLDGVAGAGEWNPGWRVTIDPLDVTITGTGNHPHEAPYYARSGYDAIALWAYYDVAGSRWYFRLDVDGRAADSDSQTGTPGNLGVGTHGVDGGPLGGDGDGIGPSEAYRLRFQYESGGFLTALLGGDSTILPGVVAATTGDLVGQGIYSETVNPGVIEWSFDGAVIIPTGTTHRELWLSAQMGDNSDSVSDDEVPAVRLIALDQQAGCPAAPAVIGQQAIFPVNYSIPSGAALGVHDVVLTVAVPAGTTFISASGGGTESGGVITWNLGTLSPGATGQVTFVLRVDASITTLTINSELTCAEGLRHQSTAECPVRQPPPTPPSEEIPEGSTLLLLGSGLAALAGLAGLARARLRR